MMNRSQVASKLKEFNLEEKTAEVYLSLLEKGVQSPLELARNTTINRTTIYRELEKLKNLGLIEEIIEEHKTLFSASDPKSLELLLSKKESDLQKLKLSLPSLLSQLPINPPVSPNTRVAFFRGQSGIKQLLWNVLSAKKEHVGYGFIDWNEAVGKSFAEKLRSEMVLRKIKSREIQNSSAINYRPFTENQIYLKKFYQGRFLSPKIIEIKHDTYIYNDVFSFMSFYQGELFGIEIHNQEIAKTQKQIFEILWKMAKYK